MHCRSITRSLLAMVALATPLAALAQALELETDSEIATAGFYQLRWFADATVVLEEAQSEGFTAARSIYRGADKARVMSGKPDGVYHYRLRDTGNGEVSNIVTVTVRHHSLQRALSFFGLGAAVFLATLLLIAFGAREGNRAT